MKKAIEQYCEENFPGENLTQREKEIVATTLHFQMWYSSNAWQALGNAIIKSWLDTAKQIKKAFSSKKRP